MAINRFLRLSGLFLLLVHGSLINASAAAAGAINAKVKVFFTPRDSAAVSNALHQLLATARQRALVASYFITDPAFINHLIYLKYHGIDVQVIVDETTSDRDALITKFIGNNIVPVISLSGGLMHNKFLVIDDADVWTGSANFTQAGLSTNNENIMTVSSSEIAGKYAEEFHNIERTIFDDYIERLANVAGVQAPNWWKILVDALYAKNERFKTLVHTKYRVANSTQKNNLQQHFRDLAPLSPARSQNITPISAMQREQLRRRHIDPDGLSYGEAYDLLGDIWRRERMQREKVHAEWEEEASRRRQSGRQQYGQ